jgi:hypothetical protein
LTQGVLASFEGRWRESRCLLDEAEQVLRERCVGVASVVDLTRAHLIGALSAVGDLEALRARLQIWLRGAEERAHRGCLIIYQTGAALYPLLADDDPEGARRRLERSRELRMQTPWTHLYAYELLGAVSIDLYSAGDRRAAWERVQREESLLRATHALRIQQLRIGFWDLRARAALAAATVSGPLERSRLCAFARQDARRIERARLAWAQPLALMSYAGLAQLDGATERAAAAYAEAARGFDDSGRAMGAAVARRLLRELGGSGGGDDWFRTHRIVDADRFTRVFAPVPASSTG